jgi:hypothetical protein
MRISFERVLRNIQKNPFLIVTNILRDSTSRLQRVLQQKLQAGYEKCPVFRLRFPEIVESSKVILMLIKSDLKVIFILK